MIKENLNLFLGNRGLAGVNRPEKLFKLSVSCLMPQAPNCRPEVMNNMFFGFLEQAIHEAYDLLVEKGQKSLNSKLKERDKDPVMPLTPEDLLLILAQFQFLDAKTINGGGLVDKDISGASAIRWFVKTQPKERQDALKKLNVDRLDKDMLKDIISTLGRNERQKNMNRIISDILSQVKISNVAKGLFSSENVNMVNFLSQIIEKINIQLKEGKDEITIRLKPEVLGRLKIKVGWDQGMLKVNFFATTHIAKQALEQNLNILSQMLLQQGLPVGEMSVLLEPDGHAPNSKLPRKKAEINLPTPNPYPPNNFLSEIEGGKQSAVLENTDIIRDNPILSQIIEKINIQLKEGKDEITIRLKPEVLGRLKIKVGWDQGMLKVNFFATTHIAKQALEQNLNILSQILLQQGLPVGEMSVLLEPDGHAPNSRRELVRYPKRIGTITHFVKSVSPEVPLGKDNSLDILA